MDKLLGLAETDFRWLYAALLLAPALISHLWAERQRRRARLSVSGGTLGSSRPRGAPCTTTVSGWS